MNKKLLTILIICIFSVVGITTFILLKPKSQQAKIIDIPNYSKGNYPAITIIEEPNIEIDSNSETSPLPDEEQIPTNSEVSDPLNTEAIQESAQIFGKPVEQLFDLPYIDKGLYPGERNANINNGGFSIVYENYLFLTEDYDQNTERNGKLIKIDLITADKMILLDAAGARLVLHNGWLYYVDLSQSGAISGGPIYRIKQDGGTPELINNSLCGFLLPKGDCLIYYNYDTESLYEKDLENLNNDPECLISYKIRWINDGGDRIIFYNTEKEIIQSMDINTKQIEDIYTPGEIMYMILAEDTLYYTKNVNEEWLLTAYNLSTGEEKTLIEKSVARFTLYKGKIVFTYVIDGHSDWYESMVCLFDPITKDISEIGEGNIGSIFGDKMIYWFHHENDAPSYLKIMDLEP